MVNDIILENVLDELITLARVVEAEPTLIVALTLKGAQILGKDKELAKLCHDFVKANPIPDPGVGATEKH